MISRLSITMLICATVLTLIGGCGAKAGDVSGKVTFGDKPVDFGTIAFVNQDGNAVEGRIQKGTYRLAKIPVGPAKVVVAATPQLVRGMVGLEAAPPPPEAPPFVPTPKRYADPDKTDLAHTVVGGSQTYDIVLKP